MKIKSIKLEGFRRFKKLTIEELPETARLVVMIGPNGSGKSSVFDALLRYKYIKGRLVSLSDSDAYYIKFNSLGQVSANFTEPKVEFHTADPRTQEEWQKCMHVRSAYRNDLTRPTGNLTFQSRSMIEENRFIRLAENDQAVALNYSRLLSQWIERSSANGRSSENLGQLQDEVFGGLRDSIVELFKNPKLVLNNLGSPSNNKIFQFDKGTSQEFSYQNLSSGEKAALDLLLDITVAKEEFNNTVFCIDEPEAHIHTKLQGPLLEQLYKLIPDNSQLWIATHSIGMVRKAYEIWSAVPDSVVFLDFGKDDSGQDRDFDGPVKIKPAKPSPNFWASTYEVALGDLAGLVVTGRTVFCEGEEFDAECYKNIFKNRYPEINFVSLGARGNVEKSVTAANLAIEKIVKSARVIGIVDRDKATCGEIKRNAEKGIRTLSRKTIESYLLDDEVLTKLCEDYGESDKVKDLLTAKQDALDKHGLKASDNLKPIVQQVHGAAQKILKSANLGNTRESFMMDELAPRIQPGMKVYEQLEKDIFGE